MSSLEHARAAADRPTDATMRAVVQDAYGSAEVLRVARIPRPVAGEDDVLIDVRAASLHIGDCHFLTGQPYLMRVMGFGFRAPKARVRGTDVAGRVAAVGTNVTRFRVGDEVFGTCDGAFAEQATARQATLALKPPNLSFDQAAAVPTSACTALQALRDTGGLTTGQRVLIIGASGGVGIYAVQIAKALGGLVTGVCSTSKIDLVRSLGADQVIDYQHEDPTDNAQSYDLILDAGGNRSLSQLRRCLAPQGTLVLVGGEGGGRWIGAGMRRSLRALALSPFIGQKLRMLIAAAKAADLDTLSELIKANKLNPVIEKAYPLDETADAIRYLQTGRARGKLIIVG